MSSEPMSTWARLQDVAGTLFFPWYFMSVSARHIPKTISDLRARGEWSTFLSIDAFCDALFGQFWATVGPNVREAAEVRVLPLLQGRVSGGVVHDEPVGPPVRGRAIEVGAGSGMWAHVFAELRGDAAGAEADGLRKRVKGYGLEKVYGIEPNAQSAQALRKRVAELGLDDIYEVIPLGIEALSDPDAWEGTTIEPGSIDSVVSILCMCSIPDQADNIKALYRLLKPGGTWYTYEHVKASRGGLFMALYQRFVNVFWSFFVGSCRLCKPTDVNLLNAGAWSSIDMVQPPDEAAYRCLPHILGTLTK